MNLIPLNFITQGEQTPLRRMMLERALAGGGALSEYEITGNPVAFNTNVAKPLSAFTIPFLPMQSGAGDPSPSNVRPISGWNGLTAWRTGVNLFHPVESEMVSEGWNRYFPNPMKKAGKYSISCQNTFGGTGNLGCSIVFVAHPSNSESAIGDSIGGYTFGGETKKVIENITITEAQANAEYIRFAFLSSGATYNGITNAQIQIEYGETASPYAEYTGDSYPVTFPALGKNLCPDKVYQSSSLAVYLGQDNATDFPIKLTGGVMYTLSFVSAVSVNGIYLREENEPGGISIQKTFMPSVTGNYRIALTNSTGISPGDLSNVMLNEGSTAESYEPFTNTVYGGTLDAVNGVLTVTHIILTCHKSDFGNEQTGEIDYRNLMLMESVPKPSSGVSWNKARETQCLNCGKIANPYSETTYGNYIGVMLYAQLTGVIFRISSPLYDALSDDDEITICYEIAEPYEIPLSDIPVPVTLIGDNTIWTDTNGENTVKYLKKG